MPRLSQPIVDATPDDPVLAARREAFAARLAAPARRRGRLLRGLIVAALLVATAVAGLAASGASLGGAAQVAMAPPEIVVEALPGPLRPHVIPRPQRVEDEGAAPSVSVPSRLDHALFPLDVRTVALDPGHGGPENPGTVGPNGAEERDLTLDIALRLARLLEERDYGVVLTRDDDRAVSLEERAEIANAAAADLFVSIHVNWLEESRRGIETFFLGPLEEEDLARFTAFENRHAGYTVSEIRQVLEGVYAAFRREESRKLARSLHRELAFHVGEVTPQVPDRGVKSAPFVVLVGTEMPAVLVEVSALSHHEDARLLTLPAYRQYIALALLSGIRSYAQRLHEADDEPLQVAESG